MTLPRRILVAVVAVLALSQGGWEFYNTNPKNPSQGLTLRWYRDEVPVAIDKALCADVPDDLTLEAIRDSMATWNAVPCNEPPMIETGIVEGVVPIRKVKGGEVGGNVIVFQDSQQWMSDKNPDDLTGANTVALTTLFYDPGTGEIRSYALEMNDGGDTFEVLSAPGGKNMDLANTLTHEMGHVLGLDHSGERMATMFFSAYPGEISKRTLWDDDRSGLCKLYETEYAEVNPDHSGGGGGGGGCQAGGGTRGTFPLSVPLLLAILALVSFRLRTAPDGRDPRTPRAP